MSKYIRWGILGASNFAKKTMAPAIHEAENGCLKAIATSSPQKAAPFAALAPEIEIFDSYDALLASPDIDAIYIPLPNHMHVEWSQKAARAGKHVLCEKPIALNAKDIDQLIQTQKETGKLIAEGFMVTHHPQWEYVRNLLSSNAIGQLKHVQGVFTFFNDDATNIRNKSDVGGGALYDIGVYPVVTARYALGEDPAVKSCQSVWENGIDTISRGQLEFSNNVSFDFYVSMRMNLRQEMVFHGTQGFIRVNTPFNATQVRATYVETIHADGTETVQHFPSDRQYVLQVSAFNNAILNNTPFPCTLEFSKGNQTVIDSLLDLGRS